MVPLNTLPPDRGTPLLTTPLVAASPVWPETWMSTWSKSSGEKINPDRPACPVLLPARRPSTSCSSSPARPP
jgi:hypothetical protein